jgi:hypothetical protein
MAKDMKLTPQEFHARLLPCFTGIKQRRDAAHRRNLRQVPGRETGQLVSRREGRQERGRHGIGLRTHTALGSDLILLRLRDALGEEKAPATVTQAAACPGPRDPNFDEGRLATFVAGRVDSL